jgi:hypothetical protein
MAMLTESGLRRLIKEELRKVLVEQQAPEGSIAGSGGSTYKYRSLKGGELSKLIKQEQLEALKKDNQNTNVETVIAPVYANVDFIPFKAGQVVKFFSYRKARGGKSEMYDLGVKLPISALQNDINKFMNDFGAQT